jgi:hypothetical protein
LNRSACLPVIFLAAVITAASAHAGDGKPASVRTGLSTDASAGGADVPDKPSLLIATGDFNGDGIADVVETTTLSERENSTSHLLIVLLGQPDDTFMRVASQALIGKDPRALVVGDFNGDGNQDVIVGDGDGTLQEFVGDGRGNLLSAGSIAKLGSVVSIAVGHFTLDGNLDLVVSDVESNSAEILLGAGDGSFRHTWSFQLPRRGTEFHIATADFNKDGIADLVITSENDENYEVMLGNGNGTFTYAPTLSHLKDPYSYCPS